jgi:hypothetical protein
LLSWIGFPAAGVFAGLALRGGERRGLAWLGMALAAAGLLALWLLPAAGDC